MTKEDLYAELLQFSVGTDTIDLIQDETFFTHPSSQEELTAALINWFWGLLKRCGPAGLHSATKKKDKNE